MCYLWSLPLWTFTLLAMHLPFLPVKFLSHNSLGHFTLYTKSCWWSNLLLSLIWKQVLSFLSVYAAWVFTVSGSSLCTVFFTDFIILSALFPLNRKSWKCFLLFGTFLWDEFGGNCCWRYSCSSWWLLCLISQKMLLIAQNVYWFCSWKTFLMWLVHFVSVHLSNRYHTLFQLMFLGCQFSIYLVHAMPNWGRCY